MAKKSNRSRQKVQDEELPEMNEVDEFNSNREKILFDEAGEYGRVGEEDEEEDEEVMGINEEGSEGSDEGSEEEEEEEEEGWGSKQNYYGGDDADNNEVAKQMEEEALKQQKKHLKDLGMDDFVDEDMMEDWQKSAQDFDEKLDSKPAVINDESTDFNKLDKSEKLEILSQSFPEFIPLLKELNTLKPKLSQFQDTANEAINTKRVALTSYLGAIMCYFGIFVEHVNSGEPFTSMKDNAVMESILTTRQIWQEAERMGEGVEGVEGVDEDSMDEDVFVDAQEGDEEEGDEEEGDEEEGDEEEGDEEEEVADESSEGSEGSEGSEEESASESDSDSNSDIDITKKRTIKTNNKTKSDDFTESNTPADVDMEEKQRRKKSLRFYTSKIDQAHAKNQEKMTGDLDIPYKERLYERRQRLMEEARKRGLGQSKQELGDDLDANEDINSEDERMMRDINDDVDNDDTADDGYYEQMKHSKLNSTQARQNAHKQAVKAAREGKLADAKEELGEDGKRALNFQILKNKGLTNNRRKEIRNARVKKRKKYDKANKKLKSVRKVYNDASTRGPYEGEKTGIKKGLSRSVKLN